MNPQESLKRRLLSKLERDMDQILPQSRRIDESGRIARQTLLNLIMASWPKFPLELWPPALRRGDDYEEMVPSDLLRRHRSKAAHEAFQWIGSWR